MHHRTRLRRRRSRPTELEFDEGDVCDGLCRSECRHPGVEPVVPLPIVKPLDASMTGKRGFQTLDILVRRDGRCRPLA